MTNYIRAAYYLFTMMRRAYRSPDKLIKYQNKKVRQIVRYAYYNVPFYHDTFEKLGIKPSDIKTRHDLNKLPVVRKNDIRSNITKIISKEFDVNNLKKVLTSGSTGQPLTVYLSKKEDEFRKAKHLRANIACGQKPRDRWVITAPPHRSEEVARLQRILGFFAFTPISMFEDVASQLATLEKIKPDVLDGYSNSLVMLAKEAQRREVDSIKPKLIIGGAELISRSSRRLVEEVFDAPFYDQYACFEFERMAWQCREKLGYHIDADSIVMQFVDKDGEEVRPGERGEIVCTSLFNYAMPFIRYAVGDIGKPSEDTECLCGRTFPLMEVIEGRKDSLVILPDGRIFSPLAFVAAISYSESEPYIDQFRVIQKKVDLFHIQIKLKDDNVDKEIIEKGLIKNLERSLKINTHEISFEIDFVDDLRFDKSGKYMTVVSELNAASSLS